jgi:hypothetical protein
MTADAAGRQYRRSIVRGVRRGHTCMRVRTMFVAAFILVISVAALVQFAAFSWRAGLLRVVGAELAAEGISCQNLSKSLQIRDFDDVAACERLCSDSGDLDGGKLGAVRLYYNLLCALNGLGKSASGSGARVGWTAREMALCTRYATVVLTQRMQRNQELAIEVQRY